MRAPPITRTRVGGAALAVAAAAMLALALGGAPAAAHHETCSLFAYLPEKLVYVGPDNTWIKSRSYLNCADGTTATVCSRVQIKRSWGWDGVGQTNCQSVDGNGNRQVAATIRCEMNSRKTYRTHASATINHSYSQFDTDSCGVEGNSECADAWSTGKEYPC